MIDLATFKALCELVADEDDPAKLEILKTRMKALLRERENPAVVSAMSIN